MAISNADRAACAEQGLLSYSAAKEGGDDLYDPVEDVLSDFLADLMHFADSEGISIDFQACLNRASMNHEAEK